MSTTLTDLPLSAETRSFLERGLIQHVIDGESVGAEGDRTFDVYDPSSGQVVTQCASADDTRVDSAVSSSRRAFDDGRWRNLPALEKERRLRRFAALVDAHRGLFSDLDCIDAGILRPYGEFIVDFAVGGIEYYSGWPTKLLGSVPEVNSDVAVKVLREPVGVVALIVPWNGPTAVAAMVAAALATGNCVILKPAEQTPMSAYELGHLGVEAGIPAGVFNVVQGGGAVGAALVRHPGVDKISFTGSVETGRAIAREAANTLKRVSLELGGKSPFIIFDDADVDEVAAAAMSAVWSNSGQVCTAGTRTLVQRGIHDRLVEAMVGSSRSVKPGPAFDPSSAMGPLISGEQLERVRSYVGVGEDDGASLVLDGRLDPSGGYLHGPTIFTDVRTDMRIAQEEIFGPVMSVIPFDTEDEAYRIANDVEFGLAAGVWTQDIDRIGRATKALRTGTVWVNCYQLASAGVPYGGLKQSGYGRNLGAESLEAFLVSKSVWNKIRL